MDRAAVRTEIRDILGELVADFWSDAELNRYVQEALYRFSQESRWSWLLTEGVGQLLAGDDWLTLKSGVHQHRHLNIMLQKVGDTNRPYLPKRVSPSKGLELRTMYPTPGSYPSWYYVASAVDDLGDGGFVTTVRFIPRPVSDVDVTYQYYRAPLEFLADNDVPDLPVQYHKALVHFAAGTAWLKELGAASKATEQFNLYNKVVAQAREEERSQADDDVLAWGDDEPQYGTPRPVLDVFAVPDHLGP